MVVALLESAIFSPDMEPLQCQMRKVSGHANDSFFRRGSLSERRGIACASAFMCGQEFIRRDVIGEHAQRCGRFPPEYHLDTLVDFSPVHERLTNPRCAYAR
ncbi:hypothetical protein J8I87_38220 [Paraburkholderia sp. LEh10]|uniref:hypothetical protein n=1 Tax=Paraburkholderia sp. LEh10 TaxID=2821353 RepID=UPI001AE3E708|nr:hypothetical protein [Paraburkholderia sp. LEh10]MBP0595384.1 hypothetical protein [Paraburkholderia sp. LEh10]